jgi:hypothetical protein
LYKTDPLDAFLSNMALKTMRSTLNFKQITVKCRLF